MHSTLHPSEPNYIALESGLNPTINAGNDAQANFALSNCAPSATATPPTSSCTNGRSQIASSTPPLYSLIEHQYGVTAWKDYSDNMPSNCAANHGTPYANVNGTVYNHYLVRHDPAPFFAGLACSSQSVPSGAWQNNKALYTDLMSGNFSTNTQLQTVTVTTNLHLNTWTLVQVTGVALRAGERIIPQIYSSKETTANGSLVYDDCSVTARIAHSTDGRRVWLHGGHDANAFVA